MAETSRKRSGSDGRQWRRGWGRGVRGSPQRRSSYSRDAAAGFFLRPPPGYTGRKQKGAAMTRPFHDDIFSGPSGDRGRRRRACQLARQRTGRGQHPPGHDAPRRFGRRTAREGQGHRRRRLREGASDLLLPSHRGRAQVAGSRPWPAEVEDRGLRHLLQSLPPRRHGLHAFQPGDDAAGGRARGAVRLQAVRHLERQLLRRSSTAPTRATTPPRPSPNCIAPSARSFCRSSSRSAGEWLSNRTYPTSSGTLELAKEVFAPFSADRIGLLLDPPNFISPDLYPRRDDELRRCSASWATASRWST